jgi:hypothetical protein
MRSAETFVKGRRGTENRGRKLSVTGVIGVLRCQRALRLRSKSAGLPGTAGMSVLLEFILNPHQSSKEDGSHGLTIYNQW